MPRRARRGSVPAGWRPVAWGLCLALVSAAAEPAAAEPAAPSPGPARSSGWTTGVSLLEEYRLRRASRALTEPGPLGEAAAVDDQLDHRLRLHADAQVDGLDDRFRGLFSGALWWDLNGPADVGSGDLFASSYDDSRPWVAPYALSVEWHDDGVLDHARLGRQDAEHGLPLTFDGASLGLRPFGRELLLFGFGGRTVHFFQTDPGFFEAWVASAGASLRPLPALQLELDGRLLQERVDDSVEAGDATVTTVSYGLSAATRTELVTAKLRARGLDEQPSHLAGAVEFFLPSSGLGATAELSAQIVTLNEIAESENPYFALLGPSLPHARYRFELFHELALGEEAIWTNLVGWRGRQVVGHEEQPFNRNVGAAYLHSRVDDLLLPGLYLGATVGYDYVPTARDEPWLVALGGAAGYVGKALRTELGTDYQRYKIKYYQRAEELHDARTVYGAVGYRVAAALELRGRYELEIVDRYLESFTFTARQDF